MSDQTTEGITARIRWPARAHLLRVRFEHGLLTAELKREVPEALKPRRIEIAAASGQASVAQNNVTTLEQPKVA